MLLCLLSLLLVVVSLLLVVVVVEVEVVVVVVVIVVLLSLAKSWARVFASLFRAAFRLFAQPMYDVYIAESGGAKRIPSFRPHENMVNMVLA